MAARYGRPALALLGVLVVIAAWNTLRYPPGLGYDAIDHIAYAESILHGHGFPDGVGEYYTPPGFYAVTAGAIWLGEQIGLGQPLRVIQLVNAVLLVATAVLLLELARLVFPSRRRLHVAALGPLRVRGAGATIGRDGAPRADVALLHDPRARARGAHDRAESLDGAVGDRARCRPRRRPARARLLALDVRGRRARARRRRGGAERRAAAGAGRARRDGARDRVVAGPWYAYQSHRYTNPVFDRPQVQVPLLQRRPAAFYVNPELRAVFGTPYKTSLNNRFVPQLYTDGWGDYYGVFVWNNGDLQPGASARRELRVQMWLAIVPTLLLVGGWLALLARSLSRERLRSAPERLLVGLLPLAGIVGMLYFTVSYPTPDGDVVKATYMLTTVPAWALCFGYGLDSVLERRPRLLLPLCILLGLAALSGLRLALYGSPLGIL